MWRPFWLRPAKSRSMLLFPRPADNTYRGYTIALWIFAAVVLVRTIISVNSIVNPHAVASSADGIPVETFGPAGAQAVISLFTLWGIAQLVICIVAIVVLFWYRGLVPLMFALLLLEHLSRRAVLYFRPIASVGGHAGSIVNTVLLALMLAGLVLSSLNRERRPSSALRG